MSGHDRSLRATLTMPGLLMAYAVVAFAVVPLFSWWTVESLQAGRAVDAHCLCDVDRRGPCLERRTGILHGPDAVRRSVNDLWWVSGSGEGHLEVGPGASGRLETWAGDEVEAFTYRGDLALVVTPDGQRTTDVDVGARGVVYWGAGVLVALVVGGALVRHSRRRLRETGGWWQAADTPFDFYGLRIVLAGAPPFICLVLLQVGASWRMALSMAVAVAITVALAAARSQRRERATPTPRHARWPD